MLSKRFLKKKKPVNTEISKPADLVFEKPARLTVKIDGEIYELKNASEFELEDFLWMQKTGARITEMSEKEFTSEMVKEMITAVNAVISKILLAPESITEKLSDMNKIAIINFFSARMQAVNTNQKSTS